MIEFFGRVKASSEVLRVEAVSSDGGGVKFRLVLADQTLEFQAASVAARLEWMSQLEAHLGQLTWPHAPWPPRAWVCVSVCGFLVSGREETGEFLRRQFLARRRFLRHGRNGFYGAEVYCTVLYPRRGISPHHAGRP